MKRFIFIWVVLMLSADGSLFALNDLLAGRIDYETGISPAGVIAADLDGDGDMDLAVAVRGEMYSYNDSIAIFINNGDGTFATGVRYISGDTPFALAAADLDGDGDKDLAVVNRVGWNVRIFYNYGDGTFEPSYTYAAGQIPTGIDAADLNGDGHIDLAVSNSMTTEVSVLINKGDGTFNFRVNYPVTESGFSVRIADFDGDGDNDLAVGTASTVDILLNNGSGIFQNYANFGSLLNPAFLEAADFDGDGDVDLAAGRILADSVVVFLNNGDATFANSISYVAGSSSDIVAADFDRDGDYDLASANDWAGSISVLLNNGSGVFVREGEYGAGERTAGVCAGDWDGDGDLDVAVTNSQTNDMTVYFNQTYTGRAIFDFDTLNGLMAYAADPPDGFIYIGAFEGGYTINDIDLFTVVVNGTVSPSSFYPVSDFPGLPGTSVRLTVDLGELTGGYGPLWETEPQIVNISGLYTDETPFAVGGDVIVIGLCHGDGNLDGRVNIGDPVFLISFLYRGGQAPRLDDAADANGDGSVDLADATYLVNYIFRDGPPPVDISGL